MPAASLLQHRAQLLRSIGLVMNSAAPSESAIAVVHMVSMITGMSLELRLRLQIAEHRPAVHLRHHHVERDGVGRRSRA